MSEVRTLSVRLDMASYQELERKAQAEGRTLAGYARAHLLGEGNGNGPKPLAARLDEIEKQVQANRKAVLTELAKLEALLRK